MAVQQDALSDTIVAMATASAPAALAIVRLSGPQAFEIAGNLTGIRSRPAHRLMRARVARSADEVLDDALVVHMPGPHSYTGEDVVELHLHGAPLIVQDVVQACQAFGARLAQPGEYTLRAFVHGRMDLAQAEAVGAVIGATSEAQRRAALRQLGGGLSAPVAALTGQLEAILAAWRAALDFPEYPTGEGFLAEHAATLQQARATLETLQGRCRVNLRRVARVVLCGAPNVGKSTLLNAWAGERRALVDASPGTTRDPIEVEMGDEGGHWTLCDTAGVRPEAAGLEAAGIDLGLARAASADWVIWLCTGEQPAWPPPSLHIDAVVGSKADTLSEGQKQHVACQAQTRQLPFAGWLSAHSGEGCAALRAQTLAHIHGGGGRDDDVLSVQARHVEALRAAHAALGRAVTALASGQTLDVLTYDVEEAARWLGAILGRDVDAAVLDRIFASFCIGK